MTIRFIGDTHFGRNFTIGNAPIERKGEREKMFYDEFEVELFESKSGDIVIQLGDLFDAPIVSVEIIKKVYNIIKQASELHPDVKFVFLRGNHDSSRDSAKTNCFYILSKMCDSLDNVYFIQDEIKVIDNGVVVPWDYFREGTLEENIEKHITKSTSFVVGHFEEPVDPYLQTLDSRGIAVFSGHIHKPHFSSGVHFIGSLFPIAHGEEIDNSIMETLTLEELIKKSPEEIKNKCIRVELKKGEELPKNINCLQLIKKRTDDVSFEDVVFDVKEDGFDIKNIFYVSLQDCKRKETLYDRYEQLKAEQEC